MSSSISRRGVAAIAAATFALFVALATASQAGAARYYACVKKNGSAHIYTKKPRCRRGEKRLSWNNIGPSGPAGRNGRNGTNGKNGTNGATGATGAKGETGAPGGFFGVLPAGKMMTGTYASQGDVVGEQYRTAVSFLLSLPAAPTGEHIHYIEVGEAVPAGCGGTVAAPVALPGNLCIFEGRSTGNGANRGEVNPVNDEAPNKSMPVFGFGVYATCETLTPPTVICVNEGTWAVTA
jgi:hypothetical protein